MPIVRLSRDKRGLDTVYLIDTGGNGGRASRARVLYFWTAPPGLRVGRQPFDEVRRRTLEHAYPDLTFEWQDLLRALEQARLQAPIPGTDARRDSWRTGRGARGKARAVDATVDPGRGSADGDHPPAEPAPTAAPEDVADAPTGADPASSESAATAAGRSRRRRRRTRRAGAADGPSPSADL